MLSAKRLSKAYNGKKLFSDASFDIQPGTISFMLGPSGTGKTTLLKLLATLEDPDEGSIAVDNVAVDYNGHGVTSAQQKALWPDVTMVFQQLFLWPHLTLRENILLPILKRKEEADRNDILEKVVTDLGMAEFVNRYPNQVSGGERQRAAIARAVALEPKYILLDEVTSALDIHHREKLQRLLDELLQQRTGIMAITHSLSFAEYFFPKPGRTEDPVRKNLAGGCYILDNGRLKSKDIHELVHRFTVDNQPLWQDPGTGL